MKNGKRKREAIGRGEYRAMASKGTKLLSRYILDLSIELSIKFIDNLSNGSFCKILVRN